MTAGTQLCSCAERQEEPAGEMRCNQRQQGLLRACAPGSLLPSTPLRRRKDGSTPRPLLSKTVCSMGNASAPRAAAVKAAAQEEKAVRVAPRLAMAADISRL